MEYYQANQSRARETAAVINTNIPALTVGGVNAAELLTLADGLDGLAQARDNSLAAFDAANNAENLGFLALQGLVYSLPQAVEGDLDDEIPAESALIDLLAPVYAVKPRTTAFALERGKKLVSALTHVNTYLAGLTPPRAAITSGGKGVAELTASIAAQPALQQKEEDRAADARAARTGLRTSATELDRLNKRFYSRLESEARTNPTLATALSQITTDSANTPGTLGIRTIVQGGTGGLQVLVAYESGSFDDSATNTIEWMVTGTDTDFSNSAPADPSGNALGPFPAGSTVKLRTRVTNGNGTTTGSIRTLVISAA